MLPELAPAIALPDIWTADWIRAPDRTAEDRAAPIFRREIVLDAPIRRAVWHLAGLGTLRARINGADAAGAVLGPALADHSRVARAISVDVTDLLKGEDRAVLAIDLGRGFYDLHVGEAWGWSSAPWRDRPRLTAELLLEAEDGSIRLITTDGDWRCATGGVRIDSLYEGETWDDAFEHHGWTAPGFDDGGWERAALVPAIEGPDAPVPADRAAREIATDSLVLRESIAEPVRPVAEHTVTWTRLPDGRFVGDIGRVIAGTAAVTVLRPGRHYLTIRYGEMLAEDGSVIARNDLVHSDRFQTDEFRIDGAAREGMSLRARHSYKGFRYLEVSGVNVGEDVQVTAEEMHAEVPVTGGTRSSNATLDWLGEAFTRTAQTNLHWQLTDTPTYEKNGWTGDAQVALPALLTRFDLTRFLTSWLDDMLDAQREDGALPVIIPSPGWGYGDGECAPAPEWTTLYPVLVDALVGEYGLDLWPLHAGAVDRYLGWELGRLDEDGLAVGILGDYLAPGRAGPPPEDIRLASSLALHHALDLVVRAGVSTRTAEFAAARDALEQRVNEVFFDADAGLYAGRPLTGRLAGDDAVGTDRFRQSPQGLALDAGIVPDGEADRVLDALVADIRAREGHHDAGCLGMARLCSVLVRGGHGELALQVASAPEAPSWEHWRRSGHSTLLEMWIDPVRSRAHYFQGAGLRFVEDDLVGLTRLEDAWRRFRLAPTVIDGLDAVSAHRRAAGGEIRAGWRREGEEIRLDLRVPPGSTAEVVLPDGRRDEVGPGESSWRWRD